MSFPPYLTVGQPSPHFHKNRIVIKPRQIPSSGRPLRKEHRHLPRIAREEPSWKPLSFFIRHIHLVLTILSTQSGNYSNLGLSPEILCISCGPRTLDSSHPLSFTWPHSIWLAGNRRYFSPKSKAEHYQATWEWLLFCQPLYPISQHPGYRHLYSSPVQLLARLWLSCFSQPPWLPTLRMPGCPLFLHRESWPFCLLQDKWRCLILLDSLQCHFFQGLLSYTFQSKFNIPSLGYSSSVTNSILPLNCAQMIYIHLTCP